MTGHAVLTPLLMVILLVAGDVLAMSLTTANVAPFPKPNAWRIDSLAIAGAATGIGQLVFCAAVLAVGAFALDLGVGSLRTLTFVALAFGSQATLHAVRERRRLWSSRPRTGSVESPRDRDLAAGIAWAALGTTAVENDIRIV